MALTTTHQSSFDEPSADAVELLVIDAHEPTRLGLGLLLQRQEWVSRCLVAGDQDRARLLAARGRPAVAVVDVSQSGPVAAGVIAAIRGVRPGIQVVLTSRAPGVDVPVPRQFGAASFVPAGGRGADIVAAVRAALYEEELPAASSARAPTAAPAGAAAEDRPAGNLSPRERDVLALLVTGATNREIAAQLYLGPDTVKKHASSLYRKLGVRNRTEATQQAAGLPALAA